MSSPLLCSATQRSRAVLVKDGKAKAPSAEPLSPSWVACTATQEKERVSHGYPSTESSPFTQLDTASSVSSVSPPCPVPSSAVAALLSSKVLPVSRACPRPPRRELHDHRRQPSTPLAEGRPRGASTQTLTGAHTPPLTSCIDVPQALGPPPLLGLPPAVESAAGSGRPLGRSASSSAVGLAEAQFAVDGVSGDTKAAAVGAPCDDSAVASMLIVFDLDHTLLRTCLSNLFLAEMMWESQSETAVGRGGSGGGAAAYFIDAEFFVWFCEQAHRKGHSLAIASHTDGAADRHVFGASAAESVFCVLDHVLPPRREYLCSSSFIVCHPQTHRAPGKQTHLLELQRLMNAPWQPSFWFPMSDDDGNSEEENDDDDDDAVRTGAQRLHQGDPLTPLVVGPSVCTTPRGLPTQERSSRGRVLPVWLSTDILLLDNDAANCLEADHAGFHAACCAREGFTRHWFARQAQLRKLLGFV